VSVRGCRRLVLPALLPGLAAVLLCGADAPEVHVAPLDSVGPRTMERQTQSSLVRDYLQAWQTMAGAFQQNRPEMVEGSFVGAARDQLLNTIRQQQKLGIQTLYQDQSHDLRVLFYSPEGLSIELLDKVEFEVEVRDHGKTVAKEHVRTNYTVILTPAESKWKVRVFQGGSEPTKTGESEGGLATSPEIRAI
jgi:hypothetical protein